MKLHANQPRFNFKAVEVKTEKINFAPEHVKSNKLFNAIDGYLNNIKEKGVVPEAINNKHNGTLAIEAKYTPTPYGGNYLNVNMSFKDKSRIFTFEIPEKTDAKKYINVLDLKVKKTIENLFTEKTNLFTKLTTLAAKCFK